MRTPIRPLPSSRSFQRAALSALVFAALALLTACGPGPFDEQKVKIRAEEKPINLDGEEVMLTQSQLMCGVQSDLWEDPVFPNPEHASAKLLTAAKALHFGDDVVVLEPGLSSPYVQIRGSFPVVLAEIPTIREEVDTGDRIAEARVSAVINHPCFGVPLPLLGVKRGRFSEDVLPQLRFRLTKDRWEFVSVSH